MTASQRELFRHALLEVAEANGSRYGLTAEAFALLVARFGFRPGKGEAEMELGYLTDKGLLAEVPKVLSPEVVAWRITATGRDFVARLHE